MFASSGVTPPGSVEARALQTRGESSDAIYATVASALRARGAGGVLIDVGCGVGRFRCFARDFCTAYVGVDVTRHARLPVDVPFVRVDLDHQPVPLLDRCADIVTAIETIEHLENPRGFCRTLVRLLKPGGWLAITTPNQLSLLSLSCLVFKRQHAAFQDASYPAHRTALLEVDLRRIALECNLEGVDVLHTASGRVPLTALHYPQRLSRLFPRALSDNVLLMARTHA